MPRLVTLVASLSNLTVAMIMAFAGLMAYAFILGLWGALWAWMFLTEDRK